MKLNFNRAPYYNDFDASKNDMAVLYRPGRAVQGRELNVDRSITQHQIERFASHIFKNGSRVTGGRAAITQCEYVRLRALTPSKVGPWTQNHSAPKPAARSLHDMAREHLAKKSGETR